MNFKIAILFVSFLVAVAFAEEPASKANACVKDFKSRFPDVLKGMATWNIYREWLDYEFDYAFDYVMADIDKDYKDCKFPHQWKQQCKIF